MWGGTKQCTQLLHSCTPLTCTALAKPVLSRALRVVQFHELVGGEVSVALSCQIIRTFNDLGGRQPWPRTSLHAAARRVSSSGVATCAPHPAGGLARPGSGFGAVFVCLCACAGAGVLACTQHQCCHRPTVVLRWSWPWSRRECLSSVIA